MSFVDKWSSSGLQECKDKFVFEFRWGKQHFSVGIKENHYFGRGGGLPGGSGSRGPDPIHANSLLL